MCNLSQETFSSSHFSDDFLIKVSLSGDYDENQLYPTLYLLDAQWTFPKAVRAINNLQKSGKFPGWILIGIGYPERYRENGYIRRRARDFTYPADTSGEPDYELSGQANRFTMFLQEELIPTIEAKYPVDPEPRTLFGHSLSGFYALFNLLQFPDTSFHNFIATSVSFWWADQAIFRMEEELSRRVQDIPARLLIAAGEQEGEEQIAESEAMVRRLQGRKYENLQVKFNRYKGAGHRASAIASLVDGVRWFFGKK